MKNSKLPKIDSIEKLAEFWDTHDLTDFEDQLEEVTEPVFEATPAIKVHLSLTETEAVQKMARRKGVSPEELICTWVRREVAPKNNGRKNINRSRKSKRNAAHER